MKQVLLDTNFIITCVKQKIDFFVDLQFLGLKVLIPKQVIVELKGLKISGAKFALKLLEKNKFGEIDIGNGEVDKRIKLFADKNPEILVATLDKELREQIKKNNKMIIIKSKKKLEIV